MAENKKSFVLYSDLIKSIEHLTNEEKGILFNHLLEYVNDMNPVLTDRLVLTAWKPIELQLKRDLVKFEEVKSKRSDAGKRSAELRALKSVEQKPTKSTSVKSVQQTSTNSTVNVNVNDNVNVINKYRAFAHLCLSVEEFEKLEVDYTKQQIDKVLDAIENYKNNKSYKSLYLTAKNWLLKEPKKSEAIKQQKSEDQIRYEHVMKQMELNK